MKNDVFTLNPLDDSNKIIQIYGLVNGMCFKKNILGSGECYGFEIKFFNNRNQLIKISSHKNDGTIRNIKNLEERIMRTYLKERV